jgi:hypothetical protein
MAAWAGREWLEREPATQKTDFVPRVTLHNLGLWHRGQNDTQQQVYRAQIVATRRLSLPETRISIKVWADVAHEPSLWRIELRHIQRNMCPATCVYPLDRVDF